MATGRPGEIAKGRAAAPTMKICAPIAPAANRAPALLARCAPRKERPRAGPAAALAPLRSLDALSADPRAQPQPHCRVLIAAESNARTGLCRSLIPRPNAQRRGSCSSSPMGNTIGADSTLWGFGESANPPNPATDFHVVGYALAFSGPSSYLSPTNQNTTLQPEHISSNSRATGIFDIVVGVADRVLMADATLSVNGTTPGYLNSGNNYTSIAGGYKYLGNTYPHTSPHLNGKIPAGGYVGYKDAHAEWTLFQDMVPRTVSGSVFWW